MIVAYYLVEGRHFAIRKDRADFSLWADGGQVKPSVASKRAAEKFMRKIIKAHLEDRAFTLYSAARAAEAAKGLLSSGGIDAFKVLERDQ